MCKVLIFSCISVMLMTAAYGAPLSPSPEKGNILRTLISDLKILEKSSSKIHLDFYTPNERQECSWQVLQCYLKEMAILEYEIEDKDADNLKNIQKNLQRLMDLTPLGTGCKTCEASDKKEFSAFHRELSNFLISMLK
ncbi:interleukin-15-like [Apteryx mantelli]|uniref:Interleukin n=1 Tax=Apteryx mantelli TaxID=2696672 RepID=A0ABM4EKH2_9AVES